ncbi:hypothetical protein KP509_09G041800 [Ceratopteris richardii]|uniref:Exostosin GT47 domain-containing protein n=1 Tax=Ceratopteris richardii TaxID=49495 RepID=A0A8T2U5X0_CERRI|nr:hypothetical protein KP509_09G041800 [Ceratopteris richardii]
MQLHYAYKISLLRHVSTLRSFRCSYVDECLLLRTSESFFVDQKLPTLSRTFLKAQAYTSILISAALNLLTSPMLHITSCSAQAPYREEFGSLSSDHYCPSNDQELQCEPRNSASATAMRSEWIECVRRARIVAVLALLLLVTFLLLGFRQWQAAHQPLFNDQSIAIHEVSAHVNPGFIFKFEPRSSQSALIEEGPAKPNGAVQTRGDASSEESDEMSNTSAGSDFASPATPLPPEIMSLKRLEAGLHNARISMRKIAFIEKNRTREKNGTRALRAREDQAKGYFPWGPIYKDASIFHQSYVEMEKRFKVFVYPDGQQPLVHNGPCKEIYSTEGRFIQELQDKNPFVTKDPFKAHAFFLPFSVSMMVSYLYKPNSRDMGPLLHFVKNYVELVGAKYPFWNRSEGADHFMLSCHDWGPHVSRAHPHLEKQAIRVLCNANSSEGFVPYKDASLPEINLVGGHIPAALGGLPVKERTFLAFFAGQDHGPVRPILYKYWEGQDDDIKVFHKLPADTNHTYQEFMKLSKFCLCPGGYEVNSPRIVEAIYNDCIPVIIADGFVLPFSDVLDWEAFSIRVSEKDIPNLKLILKAVSESKLKEMQERVRQARRHFLLNQPPQPYDLFHMILHSVWLRRLNIHLKYQ